MNNPYQNQESFGPGAQVEERSFVQRVYQWMAAGLALSGFVAVWTASQPALLRTLAGGLFIGVFIAEIGLVWWLSASISRNKISAGAALAGFLTYAALNGLTLSFIFLAYTGASIATTFFITAGTFAGVSVFGWTTRTDLTSMGGYLFMGLIGILIASVVNIFFQSTVFDMLLSYAGVALFIGLTAYDTQMIKTLHRQSGAHAEQTAVLAALRLYLDFINLFLFLLRLFGRRRD